MQLTGEGGHALEVFGGELVAKEAGRGAHGLFDDPRPLRDARDQLERRVALPVAPRQEPTIVASRSQRSAMSFPCA